MKKIITNGNYTLQQKSNKRYLDAYETDSKDFSVVTRTAQKDDTQKWKFKEVGIIYTIQQKSNNRFLDAYLSSGNDFNCITRTAQNDASQQWAVIKSLGLSDTYTIQQLENGQFLDAHEVSSKDFSVVTRPAQNNDSQRWILDKVDNDTFRIRQRVNDRYLDAHETSQNDFSIVTRQAQSDDTQKWILKPIGKVYTIQQLSNGRYLGAHEVNSKDFSGVTRTAQNDGSQYWAVLEQETDTFTVQQLSNGRYLDAHEVDTKDFNVVTRLRQTDNTQKWIIKPVVVGNIDGQKQKEAKETAEKIKNTPPKEAVVKLRPAKFDLIADAIVVIPKTYKLKITLTGVQCIASSDSNKIDNYGIQQHIYYKSNGKIKRPVSKDITTFTGWCDDRIDDGWMAREEGGPPMLTHWVWEGANALLCGSKSDQIHVKQGRVRSENINNSMTFHISQNEFDDRDAEMIINTTVTEFNDPGFFGSNKNRTYNYDGRQKKVAIKDMLDILTGKRKIKATKPYMDNGIAKGILFDNFDGFKLPLYQLDYDPKIILEGVIRARGATDANRAALWMRFELV